METNQIAKQNQFIESFIREHMDDFVKGIDTDYIKTNMLEQLSTFTSINSVSRALKQYCIKKRIQRNGKRLMTYKLETGMNLLIDQQVTEEEQKQELKEEQKQENKNKKTIKEEICRQI